MVGKERGYTVIRREKGKKDFVMTFAHTASVNHMFHSIEADGYRVLGRETTQTRIQLVPLSLRCNRSPRLEGGKGSCCQPPAQDAAVWRTRPQL